MKSLFCGTLKEFKALTNNDLGLNKWKIYDQTINYRFEMVKNYSYISKLKTLAEQNEIEFIEQETISWLDSEAILLRVIKKLDKTIQNSIYLFSEAHIPFTNKRTDYILVKDNKILILEFSYAEKKYKNFQYEKKLNQVTKYKELFQNSLPKHIEIATFTFIINPEEMDENSNNKEIINLSSYINFFFKETQLQAKQYLDQYPFE